MTGSHSHNGTRGPGADHHADPVNDVEAVPVLDVVDVMAVPATGNPKWGHKAACLVSGADPELWWPPDRDRGPHARREWDNGALARRICADCAVIGDCRDAFLASRPSAEDARGIWAGVTGKELLAAARVLPGRRRPGRAVRDRVGGEARSRLEVALDAAGLSNARAAELVGVAPWTVAAWVRGDRVPSVSNARRVAVALGVGVGELFDRVHPDPLPPKPGLTGRRRATAAREAASREEGGEGR